MKIKKILVFVNSDWFFLLHIYPIINSLKAKSIAIYILTNNTGKKDEIIKNGFHFIDLGLDRKGFNPIVEIKTLFKVFKIYNNLKPNIVHHITIKPIIYGSIISRLLKINAINTICGLGYSFNGKKRFGSFIAFQGYKFALQNPFSFHFFENKDDRNFFCSKKIITPDKRNRVLNGVGTNLERHIPRLFQKEQTDKVVVTIACRMIWEKGIKEFVDAANTLYKQYKEVLEFRVYGKIDEGNPSAISLSYLKSIEIKNYIKWYGFESNMISVFKASDIIVLPSFYREGCPMVLMEACAMGLPIVTTDSVGCRECVDEGVNGFKIPIKSAAALAIALEKLIVDKELRVKMGKASRLKAERDFDQANIIKQYTNVYAKILGL